jgi:glycosyltransferase involved in cell wall biosynthesis
MREKVSACITAGNEEQRIRDCLESVRWADEIVVVDSFSTDSTPAICREYTDRVFQHEWVGYIGQKNLAKDLAAGPWILFLDADEVISPDLRDEICADLGSDRCQGVAGYEFPRMVKYLGRWIRRGDWYPDVKLRLFRKELGRCGGEEPHDRIIVDGPIRGLKQPLYHYTYDDIADQVGTINRFSTITAVGHHRAGRRFRYSDLWFRPLFRFFRGYILKLGFLDRTPGLIVAVTTAYSVFIKYAKLWEQERCPGVRSHRPTPGANHTGAGAAVKPQATPDAK